jgi:phage protein D
VNFGESYKRPIYRLQVDGKDITTTVQGRLISLTLTDNPGFDADQLDIVLDDSDGKLELPPKGATVSVAIGWADSGLVEKGTYTADEVGHSGTPDKLTIRARSADLRAGLSTQKERSWHATTIGAIVDAIAANNELKPMVSDAMRTIAIKHIDQTNESDISFLTRLAGMHDAIATVKNGKLMFIHAGGAVSASGKALPAITITRQSGDQHDFNVADRESYTHVKATWNDLGAGGKGEILWGKLEEDQELAKAVRSPVKSKAPKVAIDAGGGNIKVLRHVYASASSAKHAARAAWRRIQRGMAEFTLTLAHGQPDLMPELPATVQGWKKNIDSTDWILGPVTHNLNDNGYTTQIALEIRATEIPG